MPGLDARLDDGTTTLSLSVWNNEHVPVLEALLAAGANLAWRYPDGRTLLHLAAQNNENPAVIDALVAAGIDTDVRDRDGNTPLHVANSGDANRGLAGCGCQSKRTERRGSHSLGAGGA